MREKRFGSSVESVQAEEEDDNLGQSPERGMGIDQESPEDQEPKEPAEQLRHMLESFYTHKDLKQLHKQLAEIQDNMNEYERDVFWTDNNINAYLDILEDDTLHHGLHNPQFYEEAKDILFSGSAVDSEKGKGSLNDRIIDNGIFERLFGDKQRKDKDGEPSLDMSEFLFLMTTERRRIFKNDRTADETILGHMFGFPNIMMRWAKILADEPRDFHRVLRIIKAAQLFYPTTLEHEMDADLPNIWAGEVLNYAQNIDSYFVQMGLQEHVARSPFEEAPDSQLIDLLEEDFPELDFEAALRKDPNNVWKFYQWALYNDREFSEKMKDMDTGKILQQFNDNNLRYRSCIEPEQSDYEASVYARLGKDLGVIYNEKLEVDSFFTLGGEKPRRMSLPELLRQEGFFEESISTGEYETLLSNYRSFIEPRMRRRIEAVFEIQLEDYSVREQIQFLSFAEKLNEGNFNETIKLFDGKQGDEKLKLVQSFLSMEMDKNLGGKILSAGKLLDRAEQAAFFEKYSGIIHKTLDYTKGFVDALAQEMEQRYPHLRAVDFVGDIRKWGSTYLGQLFDGIGTADTEKQLQEGVDAILSKAIIEMTGRMGTEELRNMLDAVESKSVVESGDKVLSRARKFITPLGADSQAIIDLEKFYEKDINFVEYALNAKMFEKERGVLLTQIRENDEVLEMGTGPGRFFRNFRQQGMNIQGVDFVPKHVQQVKEMYKSETGQELPEDAVQQADWHNMPYRGESKDVIFSVGRNILHDYLLPDQVKMFREAARVLKPGGRFMFNVPNREKGYYKELVDVYAGVMQERGIQNFRYGTTYDSPDGKNFATRYVYSEEDIAFLAEQAGMVVKEKITLPLDTGQGDEDWYFVLEKM